MLLSQELSSQECMVLVMAFVLMLKKGVNYLLRRTRAWIRATRQAINTTREELNLDPLDWASLVESEEDQIEIEKDL